MSDSVPDECIRQHLAQLDIVCRPTWTGQAHRPPTARLCSKKGALTRLLRHPPRGADVYGEDEAELSLFPTLTRMWMPRGQQRKIRARRRSARRKRRVILVVDQARFHQPDTSKLVAELQQRYGRRLVLCYLPTYSPECMPMEMFWNDWRDHVTHNHNRDAIHDLETDSDRYFTWRAKRPQAVLRTIGSPFAKPCSKPRWFVGFI